MPGLLLLLDMIVFSNHDINISYLKKSDLPNLFIFQYPICCFIYNMLSVSSMQKSFSNQKGSQNLMSGPLVLSLWWLFKDRFEFFNQLWQGSVICCLVKTVHVYFGFSKRGYYGFRWAIQTVHCHKSLHFICFCLDFPWEFQNRPGAPFSLAGFYSNFCISIFYNVSCSDIFKIVLSW